MLKSRSFELKQRCNQSSWESFSQMFQYYSSNKEKIETTFSEAAFDLNFNEPMNYIHLECDSRNPEASQLEAWAKKFNELFEQNSEKFVVNFSIRQCPAKYKNRVFFTHTWFVKHEI